MKDDAQLIAACRLGDSAAFAELVGRHQQRLFQAVYRFVDNVEDARDICQETFIKAFQALDTYHGDSQFYTWLYRIAVNAAISWKRKARTLVVVPAGRLNATDTEPADGNSSARPSSSLEKQELQQQVRAALARLSVEHRAVLILKEIEGLKYEEIAKILGVALGTIRSRLFRARLELREILEKEGL